MARTFVITTTATEPQRVDAKGHAEAVFTVTNTTSRPIRGLAKPKPLGDTKRGWLSIPGEAERDFAPGATQQFTINFDGPVSELAGDTSMGSAAPSAGARSPATGRKYPFRLDVASALNPEEDFTEGPSVTAVTTAGAPVSRSKFPWWIIPVSAIVLLGIGITLWLLLRTKTVEVPNVVNKPVAEATNILKEHKLEGSVKETKITGTVSAGHVASQEPNAGVEQVDEGSVVELVVEAERPPPTGPTVVINFADSAPSASWTNDVGTAMMLTLTHDGLPQGSVVNRDGQPLENDSTAMKVIETHPRWGDGGKLTGTYTLAQSLSAGDKFRTQVGFLKGAQAGGPNVRLRVLFNGSVIDEISKSYDGSLRNWTVPLDDFAGQTGKFSLQVLGIPTANWAWICWINPRIER